MTLTVGQFAYLPWLRTGVGAEIARVDGTPGSEPRVTLPISVRFNGDPGLSDGVTLELFGPGEVTGFDPRTVVRTWPRPGVMDAECNYFPIIEFDQADLPWRLTPARATTGDRLTPWITLIVLEDSEIKRLVPPSGDGHLGSVEIKDAKALPRSRQLWAWAHVQVSGETTVDAAKAAALMAARSPAIRSRLIAPRRMQPNHGYTALLVPTFKRGVLAGMGQDPGTTDALAPAWSDSPGGPLTLPVFYLWRFGTGPDGDFESLARLIDPFEAPDSIGIRDMDVSAASPAFPPANTGPLGLRGMLTALNTPDTVWNPAARQTWIAKLKALLNLPADRAAIPNTPRTVTPPLYGQWPAATDRCEADVQPERPLWFQELSVDPRLRVGGGLGTRVIQANQEALMASAWDQVERVRQLNEELRQAQLARELALRLASRHVFVDGTQNVLYLSAPLHARVMASPTTVRAVLNQSPVPHGVLEGAFRRVSRPLGPMGRRQGRPEQSPLVRGSLLGRLNRGELKAAKPPVTSPTLPSMSQVADQPIPGGVTDAEVQSAQQRAKGTRLFAWLVLLVALVLLVFGLWAVALAVAAIGGGLQVAANRQAAQAKALAEQKAREDADRHRRSEVQQGRLSGDLVRDVVPPANYAPLEAPATGVPRTLPTIPAGSPAPSPEILAKLRQAYGTMLDRMARPTTPIATLVEADLDGIAATLKTKLDPTLTIAQAYTGRYAIDGAAIWEPFDPLEPLLAAPEFPQPMYRPLAQLDNEWLLPGFDKIPPNSATLLKTNQRMIEAYMVGVNHEMARELLWREYPTTQRATYFRQFWDTAGYVAPPGGGLTPEQLKDIVPIHTWRPPSDLKEHSPRPPVPGGDSDYLVLFIRGDLLRRYPNTEVYAVKAKWGGPVDGRVIDDPANDVEAKVKIAHPLFSGFMDPDANFFGFALTKEEVLGDGIRDGAKPGWYFVLAEPSGEPRFGLDEPEPDTPDSQFGLPVSGGWNNLGWANLAGSRATLNDFLSLNLDASLPDTTLVSDSTTTRWHADSGPGQHGSRSSDLAYITLQRPMRIAIHASEMIP